MSYWIIGYSFEVQFLIDRGPYGRSSSDSVWDLIMSFLKEETYPFVITSMKNMGFKLLVYISAEYSQQFCTCHCMLDYFA